MGLVLATEYASNRDKVGIGISHGVLGTHLGIVFHNGQALRVVHLAWHLQLLDEDFPKENWLVAVIDLPDTVAPQVVQLLRSICKLYTVATAGRREGIAYGLNMVAGRGSFRGTGAYKPGKDSDGLTCATFVAEIFQYFGLGLVRLETMVDHPKNRAWAAAILCMLETDGVSQEHLRKVRNNVRGRRLRPEDVCAAVEVPASDRPVDQESIRIRADEIYEEVLAKCGAPPLGPDRFARCKERFEADLKAIESEVCGEAKPGSERAGPVGGGATPHAE